MLLWYNAFNCELSDFEKVPFHSALYEFFHLYLTVDENRISMPHLLFAGPEGSGRATLVRAVLRELFGDFDCNIHRIDEKDLKDSSNMGSSNASSTSSNGDGISFVSSVYHTELHPSRCPVGLQELLIQKVVKQVSAERSLGSLIVNNTTKCSKHMNSTEKATLSRVRPVVPTYRIIWLHEFDQWSSNAQHALRRIIEQNVKNTRFVFTSSEPSKILEPLRSRCQYICVPAPSELEVVSWLKSLILSKNNSHKFYQQNATTAHQSTTQISIPVDYLNRALDEFVPNLVEQCRGHLGMCLLWSQMWFQKHHSLVETLKSKNAQLNPRSELMKLDADVLILPIRRIVDNWLDRVCESFGNQSTEFTTSMMASTQACSNSIDDTPSKPSIISMKAVHDQIEIPTTQMVLSLQQLGCSAEQMFEEICHRWVEKRFVAPNYFRSDFSEMVRVSMSLFRGFPHLSIIHVLEQFVLRRLLE